MKIVVYLPEDTEHVEVISRKGKQILSNAKFDIIDKVVTCSICKQKFVGNQRTAKFCSEMCKQINTKREREERCLRLKGT